RPAPTTNQRSCPFLRRPTGRRRRQRWPYLDFSLCNQHFIRARSFTENRSPRLPNIARPAQLKARPGPLACEALIRIKEAALLGKQEGPLKQPKNQSQPLDIPYKIR